MIQPNDAPVPVASTPVLRRGHKQPSPRRMEFARAKDMRPLPDALARYAGEGESRPDVVMWCGNEPGQRLIRDDVRDAERAGWSVSGYRSELRSATFSKGGYRVQVRSSVPWFGNETDAIRIHDAWYELGRWLRAGFGEWAYLWPTPTLTGQELLRGSLPFDMTINGQKRKAEYRPLPDTLMDLLLSVQTGGRTEILTAYGGLNADVGFIPELYNLDMRWSYASCLHGLPVGKPVHEKLRSATALTLANVGYQPSFYRFRARVPTSWKHVGLLPTCEQGSTTWPHQPGSVFWGWATGAEVQVALTYGWQVWASDLIHWPESGRHDLAKTWITQLRTLRDRAQRAELAGDRLASLVAAALRNLVVHTVGSWNRVSRIDEGFVRYGDERQIPSGGIPLPEAEGWSYRRDVLQVDEWSHPEWFGTVAGRVRAKAARMAMQLPPEHIVAIRTDGILVSDDPRSFVQDVNTPGSWRVKWSLLSPLAAPRSTGEILRILELAGTSGAVAGMRALVADTDHTDGREDE